MTLVKVILKKYLTNIFVTLYIGESKEMFSLLHQVMSPQFFWKAPWIESLYY